MNSLHRLSACAARVVAFALCFGLLGAFSSSMAKDRKPPPPAPPVDTRILVTAVDIPNQQVTFVYQDNQKKQVYTVDFTTTVTVLGNKGSLADIKVGQQVVNFVERDSATLNSIEVTTAGPPPPSATPAKKQKQQPST